MPKNKKEKSIDKQLGEFKTMCCKAEWDVKGRAHYVCRKCGEDVTMEIIFLYQALLKD